MSSSVIFSPDSVCRQCGCSDTNPCMVDLETGDVLSSQTFQGRVTELGYSLAIDTVIACSWTEPDLCSACAGVDAAAAAEAPPLLYDGHGRPLRGAP